MRSGYRNISLYPDRLQSYFEGYFSAPFAMPLF